jgi:hypothetical protein
VVQNEVQDEVFRVRLHVPRESSRLDILRTLLGFLAIYVLATFINSTGFKYIINLVFIALFACFFAHISTADTEGSIQLYSDGDCTTKQGAPILTPHGLCIETNQTSSISAISLPSCPNGHPVLYISDEESCRKPSIQPAAQSGNVGDCLFLSTGSGIGSAGFVCIDRVTTVSNAQAPALTILKSIVSTSAAYAAEFSVTSASSTSATSPGSRESQSTPGFGGLSLSDRISLGCAIGLGIAALIFAILTWYNAWNQWRDQQRHQPLLRIIPAPGLPPLYELHVRQL